MNFEGFSSESPSSLPLLKAWNATVLIRNLGNFQKIDNEQGNIQVLGTSEGSGVIIQKKDDGTALVLTNAHVATCPSMGRCRLQVFFQGNEKRIAAISARVTKEALSQDLALVEIKIPPQLLKEVEALSMAPLQDASSVYAIGFPKLSLRAKDDWQGSAPNDYYKVVKRISKGQKIEILERVHASRYQYTDGRVFEWNVGPIIMHSADILAGNSGGPLVNEQGDLIAINAGIQFSTPTKHNRYCYQNGTATFLNLGCSYFAISADAALSYLGLALLH